MVNKKEYMCQKRKENGLILQSPLPQKTKLRHLSSVKCMQYDNSLFMQQSILFTVLFL